MALERGVIVVTLNTGRKRDKTHTLKVEEAFGRQVSQEGSDLSASPNDSVFKQLRRNSRAKERVRKAGEYLYNNVAKKGGIQQLFTLMSPQVGPGLNALPPVYPLFVRFDDAPQAEALPWEVLWEGTKNFLSLDPSGRWPIARLVGSTARTEPIDRTLESELRLAIVLAAAGVVPDQQWAHFQAAIGSSPIPIKALVLVTNEKTGDLVRQGSATWHIAPEVDVVGDKAFLVQRLQTFAPNVIHFFCHGSADGTPRLHLETRADCRAELGAASLEMDVQALEPIANLRSVLLVVLNCCQGAKPAVNLHSLASKLVAQRASAVVAMRESVAVADANVFTEHFYPALFRQLGTVYRAMGAGVPPAQITPPELLWMRATDEARRHLSRKPYDEAEWTYPVLYVQRDPIQLAPRHIASDLTPVQRTKKMSKIEVLRYMRDIVRPGADAEADAARNEVDAIIRELEANGAAEHATDP